MSKHKANFRMLICSLLFIAATTLSFKGAHLGVFFGPMKQITDETKNIAVSKMKTNEKFTLKRPVFDHLLSLINKTKIFLSRLTDRIIDRLLDYYSSDIN